MTDNLRSAIVAHRIFPPEAGEETGGHEIYTLKFKDSPTRQGISINAGGEKMSVLEIRLVKATGVNNAFILDIIKAKEDQIILT